MKQSISIFWFRQDLRLADNPGLLEACKTGAVLPIYIVDNENASSSIGNASKVYLYNSLFNLNRSLDNRLNIYVGKPEEIFLQLAQQYTIQAVFSNRCYEPWYLANDMAIEKMLIDLKIKYAIFNGCYLWTPEEAVKEDGSYYKVFGAYKRKVYSLQSRNPLPKPEHILAIKDETNRTTLNDIKITLDHVWQNKIESHWTFGEQAAEQKLDNFIKNNVLGYKIERDYPGADHTSKLSPNLHFGEVSPNQIFHAVRNIATLHPLQADVEHFLSEMVWREFSCYLLAHFKGLPSENFNSKFNDFPWQYNQGLFNAWRTGNTGYPLVDAGMRELLQTGYMHNRVRMVVASFLVKNLMIHWHYGRDWFWDCLVDADLANNSASWQWVAGSGVDAAPYFRIFNPTIQGEKFDKDGLYTKKFIPELAQLPSKYLFKPWKASEKILKDSGIILGLHYPKPIVDLQISRDLALSSYTSLNKHKDE